MAKAYKNSKYRDTIILGARACAASRGPRLVALDPRGGEVVAEIGLERSGPAASLHIAYKALQDKDTFAYKALKNKTLCIHS